MYATAALSDGATLQPGVDDHRHSVKLPGRRFWTCAPEFSGRRRMHGSMQNVAPVINQAHRGGMLRLAFLSAVVSLVVSFAAAAALLLLYNIYRAEDGVHQCRYLDGHRRLRRRHHRRTVGAGTTVQSSGPPAH